MPTVGQNTEYTHRQDPKREIQIKCHHLDLGLGLGFRVYGVYGVYGLGQSTWEHVEKACE